MEGQVKGEWRRLQESRHSFRRIIMECIQGFSSLAGQEQEEQKKLAELLSRLESAARRERPETLKRLVPQTVNVIRSSLNARQRRLQTELNSLKSNLQETQKSLSDIRQKAERDPLTRIYNRGVLDSTLARIHQIALPQSPICLMMIDLDHFKDLNDRYGHPAGDEVLRKVADTLVRCFPRRGDLVCRYGGEEFTVLLQGSNLPSAGILANKLLKQVRQLRIPWKEKEIRLTCSLGFVELRDQESGEALLSRADQALYRAKTGGRDRAVAG